MEDLLIKDFDLPRLVCKEDPGHLFSSIPSVFELVGAHLSFEVSKHVLYGRKFRRMARVIYHVEPVFLNQLHNPGVLVGYQVVVLKN